MLGADTHEQKQETVAGLSPSKIVLTLPHRRSTPRLPPLRLPRSCTIDARPRPPALLWPGLRLVILQPQRSHRDLMLRARRQRLVQTEFLQRILVDLSHIGSDLLERRRGINNRRNAEVESELFGRVLRNAFEDGGTARFGGSGVVQCSWSVLHRSLRVDVSLSGCGYEGCSAGRPPK